MLPGSAQWEPRQQLVSRKEFMSEWWEASLIEAAWGCRGRTGPGVLRLYLGQCQKPRELGTA